MTPADLLRTYHLYDSCFAIGPFFTDGVTILKQQTRALNLIYALAEQKLIRNRLNDEPNESEPVKRIAVIGGGVAGMTAAIAAARLGNRVWHFEQRTELCHLQAGCDTRYVHPNIYDWPSDGSESPYAGLPLLNWQAGTAAEVARCLVTAYKATREYDKMIQLQLGATTFVSGMTVRWDNAIGSMRSGSRKFDHIVIATGFGIERGVGKKGLTSYWRNDHLNQLTPGTTSAKTESYFISGTGDGGLIDLLRVRIKGFNQAWIIDDLFSADFSYLRAGLSRLWRSCSDSVQPPNLASEFEALAADPVIADQIEALCDFLFEQLRDDTTAILNGTADVFSEVLRFGRASLFNSLITYLLYKLNAFTYIGGDIVDFGQKHASVAHPYGTTLRGSIDASYTSLITADHIVIRHGTQRQECLCKLGVPQAIAAEVSARQAATGRANSEPHWTPGYWQFSTRMKLKGKGIGPKEFLPPASETIASTFSSTLSSVFLQDCPDRKFRITLHRVLRLRSQLYFQQMSPYWGSNLKDWRQGEPGRIFQLDVGVVGLACSTGRPIVLKHTPQNWHNVWARFNADQQKNVRNAEDAEERGVRSMLAFPVRIMKKREHYVSLVVFAESDDHDFFLDQDGEATAALNRAYAATRALIKNCWRLESRGAVRFAKSDFFGALVENAPQAIELTQSFPDNLFYADGVGAEYNNYLAADAEICLHWDCVYRAYDLQPFDY